MKNKCPRGIMKPSSTAVWLIILCTSTCPLTNWCYKSKTTAEAFTLNSVKFWAIFCENSKLSNKLNNKELWLINNDVKWKKICMIYKKGARDSMPAWKMVKQGRLTLAPKF